MILEQLRLYNFRCYDTAEIYPDARFNVIHGLNGHGKTSVLEAIGLICFLRSFRGAKNSEMLKLSSDDGFVTGIIANQDLKFQLAVKLWANRKQATFNGKTCRYLSEYVGKVSGVSFSPADLEIVRGSPEVRRNWADKLAQIYDPTHIDAVTRYQKILEHRNRQLKALSDGRLSKLSDDFEIWTEELCQWGAKVIHNRIHSVDKSVEKIREFYDRIANQNANINIRYQSDIFGELRYGLPSESSLELIGRTLSSKLESLSQKENFLGSTMAGPHRDDLEISMDGNLLKSFGSQGEVRSLVLALRLTEVELFKSIQQSNPILLIDDFSSELDSQRRDFLLDYLATSDSQVFLSTTENLNLGKKFEVKAGNISGHIGEHEYDNRLNTNRQQ